MKQPLTIDEVLALQYFGMENSEILKKHHDKFEKLLDENSKLADVQTNMCRFHPNSSKMCL